MSLDDLNREQKRQLKQDGRARRERAAHPHAAPAAAGQARARATPAQYLREVRDEMRKVAWPKRPEVRRYSIIVLITVIVYTASSSASTPSSGSAPVALRR